MNIFMMHVGNFVGMCKFYFMNMAKISWVRTIFVDMEEIYGHEILAMEKFYWVCDVKSWKIFLWL